MEIGTRIIRKPELFSKLSLSDATIWRMEKAGIFPMRIRLGGNSVGWIIGEVDAWLAKKASDRLEAQSAAVNFQKRKTTPDQHQAE